MECALRSRLTRQPNNKVLKSECVRVCVCACVLGKSLLGTRFIDDHESRAMNRSSGDIQHPMTYDGTWDLRPREPLGDVATGDGLGKTFSIAGYLEFQRFPAFSIFHFPFSSFQFPGVVQRHWQPATWRPLIKSSIALHGQLPLNANSVPALPNITADVSHTG